MLNFYLLMLDTAEEKSKFEQIYYTYRQDMFKTAMSILKNSYDAEDAVHEAFIRIAKYFSAISEINCPQTKAYVIIIVRNVSFQIYNKLINRPINDLDNLSNLAADTSVEDDVLCHLDVELLKDGLKKLSDDYYNIIFLEQSNGLTLHEISAVLNISYENAKKRLLRAKRKLRELTETEIACHD